MYVLHKICIALAIVLLGSLVTSQLNKPCKHPEGPDRIGTCVSIHDCPKLSYLLKHNPNNSTVYADLRQLQCGFDKDPLVCCIRNSLIPTRASCGKQVFTEKILNGNKTSIDEFPWMAMLEYKLPNGSYSYSCGGALINNRYVLTAAHCATEAYIQSVGVLEQVRLGEHDVTKEKDCIGEDSQFPECNDPPKIIKIEKKIIHESYNPRVHHRYHDIALLRLKEKVEYSDFIQPLCLPLYTEEAEPKEELYVAGWGLTEKNQSSPIKLKAKIPVVANSDCFTTFTRANVKVSDQQMCAGGQKGIDSCNGDSGGPLMNTARNNTGQWYAEGIVSFGTACGTEGWPGVYVRVKSYLDWIEDNVEP